MLFRSEDVEGRVSAMEAEWHPKEEQVTHLSQQSQAQGASTSEKVIHDDADKRSFTDHDNARHG